MGGRRQSASLGNRRTLYVLCTVLEGRANEVVRASMMMNK